VVSLTYCNTCKLNVRGERLKECVKNHHQILWSYTKPGVRTAMLTKEKEDKLKRAFLLTKELRILLRRKISSNKKLEKGN